LLIKFTLLKDVPESERSAATAELGQRYGHRLNALWGQYKQHVAQTDMSRFDQVISVSHGDPGREGHGSGSSARSNFEPAGHLRFRIGRGGRSDCGNFCSQLHKSRFRWV
jgi:hypothetical protein